MDENSMDMYTRVKRARRKVTRDMYGIPIVEEGNHTEEDATTENDEEEEEEEVDEEDVCTFTHDGCQLWMHLNLPSFFYVM